MKKEEEELKPHFSRLNGKAFLLFIYFQVDEAIQRDVASPLSLSSFGVAVAASSLAAL